MSDFSKPRTIDDLAENFAQIKPLMNETMAFYESSRCLFCYDAPCITACPTGIDIPLFIRQINTENITGAARTIYNSNYFGHACGKVCPTEVLCEGACVYNLQDVKPIEIGRLQSFAATAAIDQKKQLFKPGVKNGQKVAVIGGGPAGIACACELSVMGYEVDIYEAKPRPSGLALHGTAPYKITNDEILEEVAYLQKQLGFVFHYNSPVTTKEQVAMIESKYAAVFLGIGLGATRTAGIPGEDLNNCIGATEFIERLKLDPLSTWVGKRVVVIGGGNTAMDAVSETSRLGAQATLVYRRDKASKSAYDFEYDLMLSTGADAVFNAEVIKIKGNGAVNELECVRTESKNGQLVRLPGTQFSMPCDMLIKATGQEKQIGLLDLIGIPYDSKGRITTEDGGYRCPGTNYFAGGDALNGGAEVVNACAEGKAAAHHMDRYLKNVNS